ncbi:hypothetical protein F7734_39740 [Scytonema sp. UIC 10036]|uniref:hypothetical protein n=1 Tax=Scytonema sp. UIC 10036 TaxID=2304196 RepID=UPI0012DA3014|nr:hypothetical protein [Scytonema sp. UIC 10036]MUG98117.1 hypothetical protein [Scytonema sp. UIC 10036]
MKILQIESVYILIEDPRCIDLISQASQKASRGISAEEFLKYTKGKIRMGAKLGKALAIKMGISSNTEKIMNLSSYYSYIILALLCSIVEQGFSLKDIEESESKKECFITADIPSSPLSVEGKLHAQIEGNPESYNIKLSTAFLGQKYAWGRGNRILDKLFQRTEQYISDFKSLNF